MEGGATLLGRSLLLASGMNGAPAEQGGGGVDGLHSALKPRVLLCVYFENTGRLNIVGVRGEAVLPLREKEIIRTDMPSTAIDASVGEGRIHSGRPWAGDR